MKQIAIIVTLQLVFATFAQAFRCPEAYDIKQLEIEIASQLEFSNSISEIAKEAQKLNQVSSYLAIGSGTLMISSSLALYYFQLNPGLIGSVVTFFRLPTGIAGSVAALHVAQGLKLSNISALLQNSFIVTVSLAAAHLESVYLIGQGLYQLNHNDKTHLFTIEDVTLTTETIELAIQSVSDDILDLLQNPPSTLSNSLTLGGSNANHFKKMSELTQLRVLLLTEKLAQIQLQEKLCQLNTIYP